MQRDIAAREVKGGRRQVARHRMAARNAVRNVVAAVSKTGLMPCGYQVHNKHT